MKSTLSTLGLVVGIAASSMVFAQQGAPSGMPSATQMQPMPADNTAASPSASPALQKGKMTKKQHTDALKACRQNTSTQTKKECRRLANETAAMKQKAS